MVATNIKPRLKKLIIKNFRAVGSNPVEIELDDIVILVGPNNSGKSAILRAYEVVMSEGSKKCELTLDDFPEGIINPDALPEIELHTVIYNNPPAAKWIDGSSGENIIREQWKWESTGKPKRRGWNNIINNWDDGEVPWGAPNVANSRRPQPHKVDAFSDPEEQSAAIIKLLTSVINDKVKALKPNDEEESISEFGKLLNQIKEVQQNIISESQEEIQKTEDGISEFIKEIFPNYIIKFDARPEEDLEKSINLFKAGSKLLMGPADGYQSTIDRQGSGARRTLMWAALRYISESTSNNDRPNVLLLDEPELCLHPNAIREACRVLYSLPQTNNWQVMVTTHSPVFVDVSRDNTTIIRVERTLGGIVKGTTLFRPSKIRLTEDDKKLLKLLNICDPYVTEFFFGGYSIIVEGDTEYTAFKYIISLFPDEFKDIHVIRARGKATIVSLIKILNQFEKKYSILHDSDFPFLKSGNRNSAWTTNENILHSVNEHSNPQNVRLISTLNNFEYGFLGREVDKEKPYNALLELTNNPETLERIKILLHCLIDHQMPTPIGCIEWNDINLLEEYYEENVGISI